MTIGEFQEILNGSCFGDILYEESWSEDYTPEINFTVKELKDIANTIDRSASEVNVEAMVKPDNGDQIPKPEWKTLLTWLVDKIAIEDKPKLSKGSAVTMIKYLEDLISKC